MEKILKEITQISIYLKEKAERVNEVALFQPLSQKALFDEESKPVAARKWHFKKNLSFLKRFSLNFQCLLYKHLPSIIPNERVTPEAKFKTVLALLLAQEEVREFCLKEKDRKKKFYKLLTATAIDLGYSSFSPCEEEVESPLKISQKLTTLDGKEVSLIDDLTELNLQMAALNYHERNEILYKILSGIERPPITSVLEITSAETTHSMPLTTRYAQYRIQDYQEGVLQYVYVENQATSSIRTQKNICLGEKGAMNQRMVNCGENGDWIGAYCGELCSPYHVMEQILLLLSLKEGVAKIVKQPPSETQVKRIKILFTSLFSWDEITLITDQKMAVDAWDERVLQVGEEYFKLHLLHYNISFNAMNKFPTPAEIKATLEDLNDEASLALIFEAWSTLGIKNEKLILLGANLLNTKTSSNHSFLEKKKLLLDLIDHYRAIKPLLIEEISAQDSSPLTWALKGFLQGKRLDEKPLKGIDRLLYLDTIVRSLGYFHNKNCQNATDRVAGANAADKALFIYKKLYHEPFLPGCGSELAQAFFKVLYSMYLVWEEPEINAWLSTGFVGEKFYKNFLQKNPETTRYLVRWLKRHPEMYLANSDYRM